MALSPQYGWSEPDNSSLVKNGAADIRTLGDAIDTSVWNVGFGQAAKNKIINGDFSINQRNLTSTTSSGYGFDRWNFLTANGTVTHSAQTFTPGAAPVAGYEATNYSRIVTSGQTLTSAYTIYRQNIENVRTFAGQTVTISFWAKASSGTPKIAMELEQSFGSGGSPSAGVTTYAGQATLSTSWARYSATIAVPSISGKTLGTTANTSSLILNLWTSAGSDFNARTGSLGIQSNTFDIWGVQLEYGSKATPFQTATGTIQGELAACQRYYQRVTALTAGDYLSGSGVAYSTTKVANAYPLKTAMRAAATSVDYSNVRVYDGVNAASTVSAVVIDTATTETVNLSFTSTGLTQYRSYFVLSNTLPSYYGISAEL